MGLSDSYESIIYDICNVHIIDPVIAFNLWFFRLVHPYAAIQQLLPSVMSCVYFAMMLSTSAKKAFSSTSLTCLMVWVCSIKKIEINTHKLIKPEPTKAQVFTFGLHTGDLN